MEEATHRDRLSAIIVGAGHMAGQHAQAIRALGGQATLAGFVDPDPEAGAAVKNVWPSAERWSSLDEALDAPDIDVVHICSPPSTHMDLASQAVRNGVNAYVEKPFAQDPVTARNVLADARERGLKMCAGHQLLFESPMRVTDDLLGQLGRLAHVESSFSFQPTSRERGQSGVPLSEDEQLVDILPHPVYLLLHVLEAANPEGDLSVDSVRQGPGATIHASVSRGNVTGFLSVSLEARPVESQLRLGGTRGRVSADFVRGTVTELIGQGNSSVDKILEPFRVSWQLAWRTTRSLARRVLPANRSYPGLTNLIEAFYQSIRNDQLPPVSYGNIVDTTAVCSHIVESAIHPGEQATVRERADDVHSQDNQNGLVVVTGGTGFLGSSLVARLRDTGVRTRVVSRRPPAPWDRLEGVDYRSADLSTPLSDDVLRDATSVIHCAAATSGGWEAHQRHSVDATENLLRACAANDIQRFTHVSSIAAVESGDSEPLSEENAVLVTDRSLGPYALGKAHSERIVRELGDELAIDVKILRPGAVVDYGYFEPPGKLGRSIGNLFVAVGDLDEKLGVVSLEECVEVLYRYALDFDQMPSELHLLSPSLPTREELLKRLERSRPGLTIARLPRFCLAPLSAIGTLLQRIVRPSSPPVRLRDVFSQRRYDTQQISRLLDHSSTYVNGTVSLQRDARHSDHV